MSKADETRQTILESARRLLETTTGPISMRQIAEAAGVTRQLLYFHFSGRAQLLLELSRAIDAQVRTQVMQGRVDHAPDAIVALREMVAVQGEIKPKISAIANAVYRLRDADSSAAEAWNEREDARLQRVTDVVRRLEVEGSLSSLWSIEAAALVAWSATSQRAWNELVVEGGWTTQQWVSYTTTLLLRSLTNER